ncbi:uncharacterized protein LOC113093800 [Carassius auratus]|uniref:Uncharacterized protein LOC113093797 n=2 Tax=Carassius auratus TaxID=7957 RepID=A0A6P6P365_CARAU|nr:uncharacterized protein LOC113093797 [Carassius auratus]XP_026115150.1 uncharacterized protein LOC113093800 [Carassius auratus]
MAFNKNTSFSSSSSSSSVVDEMSEMSLRNTSLDSSDEDVSSSHCTDRLVKHQLLMNKFLDLQYRARERQEEFQSLLERFNYIQESLEWEIEKVEKSMFSMEWLEDLQKIIDEFQANMANNVSRLRESFRKMQEVASKKVLTVKAKGKPGKDLDAKVVKSIQSLPTCPTVAELKANSTAASTYSSNLIIALNSITKSSSCSPATSKALKLSAATIENLNKAFQDHCLEIKTLKTPKKKSKVVQDVNRDVLVSPVHQSGSAGQQQKVKKLPAFPVKPKADDFGFPQVKELVRETNVEVLPLDRPVITLDTAPKDLQSPSADDPSPPGLARTFAFPKITRSVEETKVSTEQKANVKSSEETQADAETMERTETSFDETMAQKNLKCPFPPSFQRPSPVRSSALPQILQSVEEPEVDTETMERTETPFEETMVQEDHQSPFPHAFHHPSPVRSSALPQILQSVEEPEVDTETMERTETPFEETMVQEDHQSPFPHSFRPPSLVRSFALSQISQSVEETKVCAMSAVERQSLSSVHTHPSSSVKLPKIQTQAKPSLQKSEKPETHKYDSAVSGSIEEQYMKNSEEDGDKLLHASMKDPSFIIDIKAQENNLQQLDRAFQNNNISSEMYNLCRGTVNQTLKSVELRLGCLLRRYIKHVQMKQLRKTLDGNFKATRNLRDGLEFKKVHSQLCKFDHFQQSVNKIWDAKQASTDETRELCIARTAHLYQQVNAVHGLHLTGISFVQRLVSLPLLTVTPVRFSSNLCPSPPRGPRTSPSRASPARHPQIHPKPLHHTTRNTPGSFLKISHIQ